MWQTRWSQQRDCFLSLSRQGWHRPLLAAQIAPRRCQAPGAACRLQENACPPRQRCFPSTVPRTMRAPVRAQTAAQRDASSISNAALTTSDGGASAGASVDRAARAYCCTLRRSPVAVAGFTIRRDSRSPIGVSPRGISTRPSKDLSPRPSRDHPQAASRRRAARLKQRVRAGAQLILPLPRSRSRHRMMHRMGSGPSSSPLRTV